MMHTWLLMCFFGILALPITVRSQESAAASNGCVTCHAGLEDKDMSEPVALWRRSVHNPAGIYCQDCHGGVPTTMVEDEAHDPAKGYIGEPAPENVPELCGTCHQMQLDNYLPSPHGIEGAFWPNCVDCHSNHEVLHPRVEAISIPDKCEDCHENETLDRFIAETNRVLGPIDGFRAAVAELEPTGVATDLITAQIDLAKNAYSQRISHVFLFETTSPQADSLVKAIEKIHKDIQTAKTEVNTRRRFGHVVAIFLVVMAGVVWAYRRSLPEE